MSDAPQNASRHALVSGGGTGVGAAIALQLAEAGMRVTITGRRAEPLDEVAARHYAISGVTCDVTDEQSVATLFVKAGGAHGAPDVVIANAGAAASKPFAAMTMDDLKADLDVNLGGVFNVWRQALAPMKEAGWGRMIAIASTAALRGYSYVSGYCAAKHGVAGLTRALAQELARTGITVNAVCPGFTETPMLARSIDNIVEKTGMSEADARKSLIRNNPQGRFIQPDEIAAAVLWLASDTAGSVNGQMISISGGET